MDDVRRSRQIPGGNVPPVCILEFDGDLTDGLVRDGIARRFEPWACFHTSMYALDLEGVACGIIARTIGGPYAVLIAEQLQAAGAKLIIGLTSAGRVSPDLPLPCLVVATSAIRDEGTSYHYLPPDAEVACRSPVVPLLERELIATGRAVRSGKVWTTDAPYRETAARIARRRGEGCVTVEMEAAAFIAVARHRGVILGQYLYASDDVSGETWDARAWLSSSARRDLFHLAIEAVLAL